MGQWKETTMNRGIGTATSWIPGKNRSYVRIISDEASGKLKLEFQNEKLQRKIVKLNPVTLVQLSGKKIVKFMGV
jgi:hypothetical protein